MLQLRLFGSPQILWHECIFSIPRRQTRALLFLLGTHLQPIKRQRLGILFWPEEPKSVARRKVSRLISDLRNALPEIDLLRTNEDQVWLDEKRVASDTAEFTALVSNHTISSLKAAIALYGAPFLQDVRLSKQPEYDVWVEEERRSFEINKARSLETLIELHSTATSNQESISYAHQLVLLDPLDEKAQCNLISQYHQIGNREAALNQYQEYVDLLHRNHAEKPSQEILTLFQKIAKSPYSDKPRVDKTTCKARLSSPKLESITQDSPLQTHRIVNLPQAMSVTKSGTSAERPPINGINIEGTDISPIVSEQFGRAAELAQLNQLYNRASYGQGTVVMITGEPGIGKTALIDEFLHQQGLTHLSLRGSAYPDSNLLPYSPLLGAIRSGFTDARSAKQLFQKLPLQCQAELIGLLPELYGFYDEYQEISSFAASQTQAAQFEALCQLLFTMARNQECLLLVLENIHWADATTIQWLQYLGQRMEQHKILIVTSQHHSLEQSGLPWSQPGAQTNSSLNRLRYTLNQCHRLKELELGSLNNDELHQLAAAFLTPQTLDTFTKLERWIPTLAQMSGGNPELALLILGVLKNNQWVIGAPIDWGDVAKDKALINKIKQFQLLLSTEARRLLNTLAILGAKVVPAEVNRKSDLSTAQLAAGGSELIAHSCIAFENNHLKFRHEILRLSLMHYLHPWQRTVLQMMANSSHS